jgi:hypothetical protein
VRSVRESAPRALLVARGLGTAAVRLDGSTRHARYHFAGEIFGALRMAFGQREALTTVPGASESKARMDKTYRAGVVPGVCEGEAGVASGPRDRSQTRMSTIAKAAATTYSTPGRHPRGAVGRPACLSLMLPSIRSLAAHRIPFPSMAHLNGWPTECARASPLWAAARQLLPDRCTCRRSPSERCGARSTSGSPGRWGAPQGLALARCSLYFSSSSDRAPSRRRLPRGPRPPSRVTA